MSINLSNSSKSNVAHKSYRSHTAAAALTTSFVVIHIITAKVVTISALMKSQKRFATTYGLEEDPAGVLNQHASAHGWEARQTLEYT